MGSLVYEDRKLKIGITSDFERQLPELMPTICQEIFGRFSSWIEHEFFSTSLVAQAEEIDEFDAIITYHVEYPPKAFKGLKRLVIISRWGVGYDTIDVASCSEAGVALLTVPREVVSSQVASGIIAMIFALATKLFQKDQLVRQDRWLEKISCLGVDLVGSTLGSIGVGNIGSELFKRASSLGFGKFIATDPYVRQGDVDFLGVELVGLDTLLNNSDVITINCPLTAETKNMIGSREFSLMKSSAILINTARGPIIDEQAFIIALRENQIAGAAIDVFWNEPLRITHPILKQPNVILSPHNIAFTDHLVQHNSRYACLNIIDMVTSTIGNNLVNLDVLENPNFVQKIDKLRRIARNQ